MQFPTEQIRNEGQTAKFIYLNEKGEETEILSGKEIYERSGVIAKLLRKHKLKPGDRAMIAYPPGLDFLAAFVACARAGVICCSVYPPDPSKLKRSYAHFCTFADDAGTDVVLTTSAMKTMMQGASIQTGKLISPFRFITTDSIRTGADFTNHVVDEKDIMFIQYSSGSTGKPKGVMISHGALYRNVEMLRTIQNQNSSSISVCWLPQYHDLGLIGLYVNSLMMGCVCVATSPITFIRNPLIWFQLIERYRATHTAAPNFAYALIHRKWSEVGKKPKFDVSSLIVAGVGAEPVHPSTIDKMLDLGIPVSAVRPGYGLAENVVLFSQWYGETIPPIVRGCVVACPTQSLKKKCVVNVDGEIFVQGDDLASGYWNLPELTQETFNVKLEGYDGEWLRTGDLGFIHEGFLYVTGRKKELIKIRGKNYFPTDIEADIELVFIEYIRPGCSAVFQHTDESIGCMVEYRDEMKKPDETLIVNTILKNHGVDCSYIKMGPKGSTPKTTSGKVKRVECQKQAQASAPASHVHTLCVNDIVKAIETGDSTCITLDMDKSLAENGVDSIKQVQLEQALAHSRTLTEKHIELLRSESSLRNIKDELLSTSTIRLRNITTCTNNTVVYQSIHISVHVRGLLMSLVNIINIIIPLAIAGALYEISILWGAILVWMVMYTIAVMICVRILNFKGKDSFEISVNTLAYIRWYFCQNMMMIWNVFVGTWIVGTIPYNLFLIGLGARIHVTSVIKSLFGYVDGRLEVGYGVRLSGIADVAAHRTVDTLYFSNIIFDEGSRLNSNARVWPGSKLAKRSIVDNWSYLYFNETTENEGYKVKGSPSYAEYCNQNDQETNSLLIHFTRLLLIPAYIILVYTASSFVFIYLDDPFLYFVSVYMFGQVIFAASSPIIKHVLVYFSPYVVDEICPIGIRTLDRWIYPSGGPFWNWYLQMFGTRISLNSFVANGFIGLPSEASMVTVKNNSFVSFGVRLEDGMKHVVIDNSEVAYGATVPDKGIKDMQVLRNGVTNVRVEGEEEEGCLFLRFILSAFISTSIIFSYISSIYPLYIIGELMCREIKSRSLTVLCVFTPLVMIQVLIVHPLVIRILSWIFRMIHIPYMIWFMGFSVFRYYGAVLFFAGSPLYNLSLLISGSNVSLSSRVFCTLRDDANITIQEGAVIDAYPTVTGHLYFQRRFIEYKTLLKENTLYEGPGLWVGTPVEKH